MPLAVQKNAKIELLAAVPLFAGLSKAQLGELASITDEIDIPEGKVLIREGDRGREFFVLVKGQVEVRRKGKRARYPSCGEFSARSHSSRTCHALRQ
jgi:signal-transduction protein with cAMP-binding, CBS, and nucleotidyltransferase domain